MWLWLSLIANFFWSGSDLLSKIGCRHGDDKYSHLKMTIAVGAVMGLHAAYSIFIGKTEISFSVILTYLPVSLLYISSMILGYLGLRYIELSISSPICNSSGAVVAILALISTGFASVGWQMLLASALICLGVIGIGIADAVEDDSLREERQKAGNFRYSKSVLAFLLPIAYCILDALGTFADNRVLETLDEESANVAYELTFLVVAVFCFLYVVIIKKDRLIFGRELPKYGGAVCETAGQFAYIFAIADSDHLMVSAPIVSAYCITSLLWSRIFLKEKLSWRHYICVGLVIVGIIVMGVFDI